MQEDPRYSCDLDTPNENTRTLECLPWSEITNVLKSCSNQSAPGQSGIGYAILKWVAKSAPDELGAVICASIKFGIHHPCWKTSAIVAILKAKKPTYSDPKAWHPIQLLECLGKLVKKIMAHRIIYEIGKYNLIPMEQFGSRSNSSCYDTVLSVANDVQTTRKKKLISTLLMVDVKGFFDHVQHDHLIKVMYDKGFPLPVCKWVKSFVTERRTLIRLDNYISDPDWIHVGVPQGSPVSPTLACIYASEPLERIIRNPFYTMSPLKKQKLLPVSPFAYVDDYAFLTCSPSVKLNLITLRAVLEWIICILEDINLKINPLKSNMIHFSWLRDDQLKDPPPLTCTLYGKAQSIQISPTGFSRWLGIFLDPKLSYKQHIKAMTARGITITSGLQMLCNTIRGMDQTHMRMMYNTCVLPVLTYGCPIWYNKHKPQKHLLNELKKVQNVALRRILGAFRTTQTSALNVLTHVPPIELTIRKLLEGYTLQLFRLAARNPVSLHLPNSYQEKYKKPKKHNTIPFRSPLDPSKISKKSKLTQLQYIASHHKPNTERTNPFSVHAAPWAPDIYSPPFITKIKIIADPPKGGKTPEERTEHKSALKSLQASHNIAFYASETNHRVLMVYTRNCTPLAGSNSQSTSYGIVGVYLGQTVFSAAVPVSRHASSYDAEMYALAHSLTPITRFIDDKPTISLVKLYSTSNGAIKTIFDRSPHPSQLASCLFCHKMIHILTCRPNTKFQLIWTPGSHKTLGLKELFKKAKLASKSHSDPILDFSTKSEVKEQIKRDRDKRWKLEYKNLPVSRSSGFFLAWSVLRPKEKTDMLFKSTKREISSRLTQVLTGHGYFGEYYAKMNIDKPTSCPCDNSTFQTQDHLIRECPTYENARDKILLPVFPRLANPRFSLGSLFHRDNHSLLISWLEESGAFTKAGIPWDTTPWKPPWTDTDSNLNPLAEPFDPFVFCNFLTTTGCHYPA